ncbi:hypothetical protein [Streptomyces sp. NPDC004285]
MVLLTPAVLLAPVSVAATWASSQINDVDRYVRTVAPLTRDPAVQNAVTDRVTDEIVARVDVHRLSEYLARVLADRDAPRFLVDVARSSDGQLKSALRTGVRYVVNKTVTSDAFAQAWDLTNRCPHRRDEPSGGRRLRREDAVPPAVTTQDAVAAVYDTLVRCLRQATATALVIAVIVASAGYLYGPGRGAEAVRSAAGRGVGAVGAALVRKGGGTGAVGEWLRAHRRSTTVTVAAAGVLALLLWNYPTPVVVAVVLVCVLLVQAVLGVLASATTDPEG